MMSASVKIFGLIKTGVIILMIAGVQILTQNLTWAQELARKGLDLGMGIGVGVTRITQNYAQPDNNFSLATDISLGYAVSEQTELFLGHKVNWFDGTFENKSTMVASALSCLAVKHYAKPESQSGFLTAGLGLASLWNPFSQDPKFKTGFGFFAGFGHEFGGVGGIEFDFMFGQVSHTQNPTRSLTVRFLFVIFS
jgi:hypothetical protein